MWTGSVAFQLVQLHQRTLYCIYRWKMREEARRLAQELHTATHLGGQALWKLFSDRYSHKAGRRICIEVAQSCPQCQRGSDYGHRQKTTGTIESRGPWDTFSVDIVGPLPADRRHEFVIVFVDCFSRYTVLVPASNSYRRHGERRSVAPCRAVLRYPSPPLVGPWQGICW